MVRESKRHEFKEVFRDAKNLQQSSKYGEVSQRVIKTLVKGVSLKATETSSHIIFFMSS